MKPSVIVTLLVGIVIGFGIGYAVNSSSSGQKQQGAQVAANNAANAPAKPARQGRPDDSQVVYKVPVDGNPVSGPADALVTLVEFSDYECPFCSRGNETVKQLQKDYGNKLRVVMKQN